MLPGRFWGSMVVVFCLLVGAPSVSAHVGGLPFFKVNGQYTLNYQIPTISLPELPFPQDVAPATYVVNTPLGMEIDTKILQIPPEVLAKAHFSWDFGDGTKGKGTKNTHTYSKTGSFIISIYVSSDVAPTPQLIESALVQMLPTKDYALPQVVMKVNNKVVKDQTTDVFAFPPGTNLTFDASGSTSASAKIVSYQWNFGDDSPVTSGPLLNHSYTSDHGFAISTVRVTDENGLFTDAYIELQNTTDAAALADTAKLPSLISPTPVPTLAFLTPPSSPHSFFPLWGGIGVACLILLGLGWLRFKK